MQLHHLIRSPLYENNDKRRLLAEDNFEKNCQELCRVDLHSRRPVPTYRILAAYKENIGEDGFCGGPNVLEKALQRHVSARGLHMCFNLQAFGLERRRNGADMDN